MNPITLLLLATSLLLSGIHSLHAQSSIYGIVQDEDGLPIQLASVHLLEAKDSSLVQGAGNLKVLGRRANIIRPISNKTGRHTNAQMWIRFGADRPVLSKMMGHEREQTTQSYYKVNLREVIEGTKTVNFEQFAI